MPIHTLVIGAARPEDFDEHVEAAMMYEKRREVIAPVETRLRSLVMDQLGTHNYYHHLIYARMYTPLTHTQSYIHTRAHHLIHPLSPTNKPPLTSPNPL